MPIIKEFAGSKNRVLIIVQNLPVPFDRRVWQEASELRKNGYQVSIICPKGKGYEKSEEIIDGINIYRHKLPFEAEGICGYFIEYFWSLFFEFILSWKVFFKHGFDVIHACNPPDNIFLIAGFFKLFFRKKFIFDHHDINPELYEAKFGKKGFFYNVVLLLEKLTFKFADISIATNNSYKKIAIERGGMKPENVFVVQSGADINRIKIMPPKNELKYGRKFLVGYVGVMGKQEGIEYLLKAIDYIVHNLERHDISFTLIGDGTELENLKKIASTKQLNEYVNFTGRISDDELLQILNTADLCVNPDEVNAMNDKSTMNKIMEYMALGKAIVQFDVTEGRFSAGKSSLYAKPNDAQDFAHKIIELIDNTEKRLAMGKIGRERIEKELAWSFEAPKLLAAYQSLFMNRL
ncbi:MAG: glycosyltransferase family 4 protein [Pseudomonadota bacterium]